MTTGEDFESPDHNLEKIPAKAATVTETGHKEYWYCSDCDKYFSDVTGTKEISDLDDWKSGEGRIDKLPPEIIEGMGQTVTEGEKKALSFTSNAAHSDFIRVEIDGKTLNAENYTVKKGSTVVTLKADYVATLSAGEHTIGIVSENGTAAATFTIKEKSAADNGANTPQTGDTTSLVSWIALMLLCGAGITGVTVYTRRKRRDE